LAKSAGAPIRTSSVPAHMPATCAAENAAQRSQEMRPVIAQA
jgi:hypothetical protein